MFDLTDKIALVTGGSRGIGRSVSVALAKAGAYVGLTYVGNEAAAAEALAEVEAAGGKGEILRFDVGDPNACQDAVAGFAKAKGGLHILVNNAGVAIDQLLLRVKPEEAEKTWAINLNGALFCAKAALRPMMKQRHGRIINLSSVVAESGNPGQVVYATSKAGLIGMTKTLAREYAARGITVNAVAPGFIETDMTSELPEAAQKSILDQTPMGRIGKPEEIAAAVLYLASDEAAYVTGQTLRVNGGMYL